MERTDRVRPKVSEEVPMNHVRHHSYPKIQRIEHVHEHEIMAPPTFSDLGKQARDVFSKGYNFGLIKVDVKTKTHSGVEFSSGIQNHLESSKVGGNLETKYKVSDYGLTFTEKWNTDNVLGTEIVLQDQLARGLKLAVEGSFAPPTSSKTAKVKTAYAHESAIVNADVDIGGRDNGPILTASAVLGHKGFLGGYQAQVDLQNSSLIGNNFALGYSTHDFVLHTSVKQGKDFNGSIYHRVSSDLDAAVDLTWTSGSNDTRFGIGAKLTLDANASIRGKINNQGQIGLGYQQKLRDGVTATLSAVIDGKNFNQGGHKFGVGLEFEA